MNSQMEETESTGYGKRAQNTHVLPELITVPGPLWIHQPGSFLNPILLGFYGGFITEA